MPDVSLLQSNVNNGTVTPATSAGLTTVAGDLLILCVCVLGTSPTIATPGSWTNVNVQNGTTVSSAMFFFANCPGGFANPAVTLGGTVTGWICSMLEFVQTGANCALQGNAGTALAVAQLTNIFPTSGQTLYNELFVYQVARATATLTSQNSWNVPNAAWSASVQSQQGVQGLSQDTFWSSGLGQGVGQYPKGSGLLSGAVVSRNNAGWFNTNAQQSQNGDIIGGNAGIYVPTQYAGMIGG